MDPAPREGDAATQQLDAATRKAKRAAKQKKRYAEDPEYKEKKLADNRCYRAENKEELNAARRERYAIDPEYAEPYRARRRGEKAHAQRLMSQYGMTVADYNAILARQNGVCRICKRKPMGRRLAVDHCHITGMIRGLLCTQCNLAVGHFKDDPAWMRAAADYIEEAASRLGAPDCLYVRKPQPSRRGAGRTGQDGVERDRVDKDRIGRDGAAKNGISKEVVETNRITSRRGRRARSGPHRG